MLLLLNKRHSLPHFPPPSEFDSFCAACPGLTKPVRVSDSLSVNGLKTKEKNSHCIAFTERKEQ